MDNDAKKINGTINRSSAISIGVMMIIVGATVYVVASMTRVEAQIETVTATVGTLSADFIPRGELNERLLNNEEDLKEIKSDVKRLLWAFDIK